LSQDIYTLQKRRDYAKPGNEREQDKSLRAVFNKVEAVEVERRKAFAVIAEIDVAEKVMKRNEKITYAIRNESI
jgi:hypothetical protein